MLIERALNKESSYEISLKSGKKFSRGISYSGQIVFFQFLHHTCFSIAICLLQVPGHNRPPGICTKNLLLPWGFCVLAFAWGGGGGICRGRSRGAGICL